jgi:hypothetical protein
MLLQHHEGARRADSSEGSSNCRFLDFLDPVWRHSVGASWLPCRPQSEWLRTLSGMAGCLGH